MLRHIHGATCCGGNADSVNMMPPRRFDWYNGYVFIVQFFQDKQAAATAAACFATVVNLLPANGGSSF